MTVALIIVSAVLLVVVLSLAARVQRGLPGPSLTGRTVVIATHPDDRTVRGVVCADHADRLSLREAFYVTPGGEQPAGGVVHVYRSHFSNVQQIEG